MKQTAMYLKTEQIRALRRLALDQTERTGKPVSMADLVRDAIDIFLASVLLENENNSTYSSECKEAATLDQSVAA